MRPRKPIYLYSSDEESLSLWAMRLKIVMAHDHAVYDVFTFTSWTVALKSCSEDSMGCFIAVGASQGDLPRLPYLTAPEIVLKPSHYGASSGAQVRHFLESVRISCLRIKNSSWESNMQTISQILAEHEAKVGA